MQNIFANDQINIFHDQFCLKMPRLNQIAYNAYLVWCQKQLNAIKIESTTTKGWERYVEYEAEKRVERNKAEARATE